MMDKTPSTWNTAAKTAHLGENKEFTTCWRCKESYRRIHICKALRRRCYNCRQYGHYADNCKNKTTCTTAKEIMNLVPTDVKQSSGSNHKNLISMPFVTIGDSELVKLCKTNSHLTVRRSANLSELQKKNQHLNTIYSSLKTELEDTNAKILELETTVKQLQKDIQMKETHNEKLTKELQMANILTMSQASEASILRDIIKQRDDKLKQSEENLKIYSNASLDIQTLSSYLCETLIRKNVRNKHDQQRLLNLPFSCERCGSSTHHLPSGCPVDLINSPCYKCGYNTHFSVLCDQP